MKKYLMFGLLALLGVGIAAPYNCFSMGVNDTIWINPYMSPLGKVFHVHAQADSRFNLWSMNFSYPTGLSAIAMSESSSMLLPYMNSDGDSTAVRVTLYPSSSYTSVYASCMVPGYWYNGEGVFESYGAVKWEAGYYENMFTVKLLCGTGFSGGSIYLYGDMEGTADTRDGVLGHQYFSQTVTVMPGNMPGDVDGNDELTVNDVTTLISYLLEPDPTWDVYRLAAADVNGSGTITIGDVTALIYLLTSKGVSTEGVSMPESMGNTGVS